MDFATYSEIRQTANFKNYLEADVNYALAHDLFDVVVFDENRPVGIGRIIGDGRVSFIFKDIVVIPEYQHRGVGDLIMKALFEYIKLNAADGAYLGLMSTPGKESFYQRHGFIIRPNQTFGSGMVQFYEK